MSGGGSKSRAESQQTTFVDPNQAPFMNDLRRRGQELADQQNQPGSQFQQDVLNPATQAFGDFLTPQQNPFLQGQIEAGQGMITENLQQNILPSVGGAAQGAGQLGGGRQGVAEGIALRDANRQSSDFTRDILAQDYQAQQQRALQALTQAGNIGGLAFQPLQNLAQILGNTTVLSQGTSESKQDSAHGGIGG